MFLDLNWYLDVIFPHHDALFLCLILQVFNCMFVPHPMTIRIPYTGPVNTRLKHSTPCIAMDATLWDSFQAHLSSTRFVVATTGRTRVIEARKASRCHLEPWNRSDHYPTLSVKSDWEAMWNLAVSSTSTTPEWREVKAALEEWELAKSAEEAAKGAEEAAKAEWEAAREAMATVKRAEDAAKNVDMCEQVVRAQQAEEAAKTEGGRGGAGRGEGGE
jgi:hypothetical protein